MSDLGRRIRAVARLVDSQIQNQLYDIANEVDDALNSAASADEHRRHSYANQAERLCDPGNTGWPEADPAHYENLCKYDPRRAQVLATLALAEEVAALRGVVAK